MVICLTNIIKGVLCVLNLCRNRLLIIFARLPVLTQNWKTGGVNPPFSVDALEFLAVRFRPQYLPLWIRWMIANFTVIFSVYNCAFLYWLVTVYRLIIGLYAQFYYLWSEVYQWKNKCLKTELKKPRAQ